MTLCLATGRFTSGASVWATTEQLFPPSESGDFLQPGTTPHHQHDCTTVKRSRDEVFLGHVAAGGSPGMHFPAAGRVLQGVVGQVCTLLLFCVLGSMQQATVLLATGCESWPWPCAARRQPQLQRHALQQQPVAVSNISHHHSLAPQPPAYTFACVLLP